MYYMKYDNIKLTEDGFPICYLDEKVCDVEKCHYFVKDLEFGNCILRIEGDDSEAVVTFEKLSIALGEHGRKVSRQRIDQIEKRALKKLKDNWGEVLKEARGK